MQKPTALSLFHLMFDEARRTQPPSRERLSLLLGVSLETIQTALVSLEGAGTAQPEDPARVSGRRAPRAATTEERSAH